MKTIYILLIFASFGSLASAATMLQSHNYAYIPNGSQTLTFNQFDTMGGTLTLNSVTITVTLSKTGGLHQVDNDSNETGTISLTHIVQGNLTASVPLLRSNFSQIGGTGSLTATSAVVATTIGVTTGDPTPAFSTTYAGDYYEYIPSSALISDTGVIGSPFQSAYEGTGTFTTTVHAIQTTTANGVGGLAQAYGPSNVSGTVTITYDYVPEPSAALLGGLGFLIMLRRRR